MDKVCKICIIIPTYRIVGYFRGRKFSQIPSVIIIHEENFHEWRPKLVSDIM